MQESSSVDVRDPTAYRPNADARPEGAAGDLLDVASQASAANEGGVAAAWRRGYGSFWWLDLTFLGLLVFLLGAMQPLNDADLPMHLATGEWIVRHGAVPFTEPFAWTRAGAPYFAYSWLLEVFYYAIMRWSGAAGLHLFQGVILFASAGAMLLLARAAGWKPWVALCMAALNVAAAMLVVPALRPQLVLFALVPLAWACAYRILDAPRIRWAAVGLFFTSALAANSHLFFVLTAAPIALAVANPPVDRRRTWAICGAIVLGWFLSPYGLNWPNVFSLNFGYNALLVMPSPIQEFRPGFRASTALLLALPLSLVPWVAPRGRFHRREWVVNSALWVVGLVAFAYAGRLLLCWWLVTLPLSATALAALGHGASMATPRRAVRITTYAIVVLLSVMLVATMPAQWQNEGNVESRSLPGVASSSTEPLLVWLQCNTRPDASGRIYTWFNYGSYLAWRLPSYSASIDGRTIFPDSVAKPEMLTSALLPPPKYRVWQSANIAILPTFFGVVASLDTAQGWQRAALYANPESPTDSVGLWVERSWWARVGTAPLADTAAILEGRQTGRNDGSCHDSGPAVATAAVHRTALRTTSR